MSLDSTTMEKGNATPGCSDLPYLGDLAPTRLLQVQQKHKSSANKPLAVVVVGASHLRRCGESAVVGSDAGLLAEGRFAQEHHPHVTSCALGPVSGAHILPAERHMQWVAVKGGRLSGPYRCLFFDVKTVQIYAPSLGARDRIYPTFRAFDDAKANPEDLSRGLPPPLPVKTTILPINRRNQLLLTS